MWLLHVKAQFGGRYLVLLNNPITTNTTDLPDSEPEPVGKVSIDFGFDHSSEREFNAIVGRLDTSGRKITRCEQRVLSHRRSNKLATTSQIQITGHEIMRPEQAMDFHSYPAAGHFGFLSGFADIMGRRFGSIKLPYNQEKSLVGSISMFLSGFLISVVMLYYFSALGLDWSSTVESLFLPQRWQMITYLFLYQAC